VSVKNKMPGKPSKAETEKKKVVAEAQDGGAKKKAAAKKPASKAAAKKKSTGSKTNKKKGDTKKRYFKAVDAKTGKNIGRYVGSNPKQAASKAFTKFVKSTAKKGKPSTKTVLYLRESSRGSSKKIYGYTATRKALAEPQERTVVDATTGEEKIITNKFRNEIKKALVPEDLRMKGGAKKSKKAKSSKAKSSKKAPAKGTKTAAKKADKKPAKKAAKKADKKPAKKTSGSKTAKNTK